MKLKLSPIQLDTYVFRRTLFLKMEQLTLFLDNLEVEKMCTCAEQIFTDSILFEMKISILHVIS